MKKINLAEVILWGTTIGYVSWDEGTDIGVFEYDPKFLNAPIEPSPVVMKKKTGPFLFRELNKQTFKGLPGLLADSLPDKFGSALIDVWLAKNGRDMSSFNPVERLCYIGNRGMGALEFKPKSYRGRTSDVPLEVADMVELASKILTSKEEFKEKIKKDATDKELERSLTNLLVVGTSAGGARAKCIIAYNESTGEVRSGQIKAPSGYGYWILKLDGVSNNKDKELNDPKGYGRLEYAYHLMAKDCGIEMMECKLLKENSRAHFMTKRFDRKEDGQKIHIQSLCAMAHYDFNLSGAYSYEQAFSIMREIISTDKLNEALEQQYRRTVFNLIGRNQDDHTKNIAFMMSKQGEWKLTPAFDITYSYNPTGEFTSRHQMSVNGKREHFEREDLLALARKADIKDSKAISIIEEITSIFENWSWYAAKAEVIERHRDPKKLHFRLNL